MGNTGKLTQLTLERAPSLLASSSCLAASTISCNSFAKRGLKSYTCTPKPCANLTATARFKGVRPLRYCHTKDCELMPAIEPNSLCETPSSFADRKSTRLNSSHV